MKQIKIFLSGGTRGDWQDKVKEHFSDLENIHFHDPRFFPQGTSMKEIAETERNWLHDSDVVFFFFEETNPSGIGSAFEVGYAVAHNIPVIFVDRKNTSHTEWLGVHCSLVFSDLNQGIAALREHIVSND